jgi:hypothetical protein
MSTPSLSDPPSSSPISSSLINTPNAATAAARLRSVDPFSPVSNSSVDPSTTSTPQQNGHASGATLTVPSTTPVNNSASLVMASPSLGPMNAMGLPQWPPPLTITSSLSSLQPPLGSLPSMLTLTPAAAATTTTSGSGFGGMGSLSAVSSPTMLLGSPPLSIFSSPSSTPLTTPVATPVKPSPIIHTQLLQVSIATLFICASVERL